MPDPAVPHIEPPAAVLDIARRLEEAGFETWCVGGAVRDVLLGHAHLDWDLATGATPEQVRGIFGRRRTIPVGVEFGTVGVLDAEGRLHEVTTFRRDVRTDGRHAEVEFGASLDEDLARRDFTINAIAFHPLRRALHDPFGGRADLERRLVRAVGEPEERMREDRLRALRAIRFAGRLGFAIDPATWQAIEHSAPHLGRLSAERVKQELEKTMEQVERPSAALRLWRESGALRQLLPALAEGWSDESAAAMDCVPRPDGAHRARRRLLRLAALLSALEPPRATELLATLRFSKADQGTIGTLVERWRRTRAPLEALLAAPPGEPPDRARRVRRLVAEIGRLNVPMLMRLGAAHWGAARAAGARAPEARAVHGLHRQLLRSAFRDPVETRDLAIDGDDLRRAGIPPGPGLGKILQRLLEAVLEDPSRNAPGWLAEEARRLWEEMR